MSDNESSKYDLKENEFIKEINGVLYKVTIHSAWLYDPKTNEILMIIK